MKGHYLALMFSWMACSNTDLLHAESPRFTANLTVKSGLTETETTPEFDKHNIGPQLKIRVSFLWHVSMAARRCPERSGTDTSRCACRTELD